MKLVFLFASLMLFCALNASAATYNAKSCAASDVQAAINQASNGDIVVVPGGSCTWNTPVKVTQAITLNGQGSTTITWATGGSLSVTANTVANTFVTGFHFSGRFINGGCPITFNTSYSPQSQTFRFYNNVLDDGTNTAQGTMLCVGGTGPGLIDHNTFTASTGADEVIHNLGQGANDASGWTTDVVPGGPNMVFIEDNTFTYNATGNPAYFWGTAAVQSYYGARTVFRYNTVNMMQVDQHGTCGMIYARWWEIYNNAFVTNVPNASQSNYMALRGGSGVVFNNHHAGVNQVTGSIELKEDCTSGSYPLPYQIGTGLNRNSSPAYIWGNDSDMSVGSTTPTYVQQGRDFYLSGPEPSSLKLFELSTNSISTTISYQPYTYPHPLTKGSASVNAPTNLSVVVQ